MATRPPQGPASHGALPGGAVCVEGGENEKNAMATRPSLQAATKPAPSEAAPPQPQPLSSWASLGFQRPETDFRMAGALCIDCLLFASSRFPAAARAALSVCREGNPTEQLPFAMTSEGGASEGGVVVLVATGLGRCSVPACV